MKHPEDGETVTQADTSAATTTVNDATAVEQKSS
jgi:hypothetical protein